MKRISKQNIEHKYFLKLIRERDKLWKQKRSMPFVEVEPFQRGWICDVRIKPQYLSQDGLKFAIDIGYRPKQIHSLKDVKNIRKGMEQIRVGKNVTNYYPEAVKIKPKQFETFDKNVKQYFVKQICDKTLKEYYTIFVSKRWLTLRVKPNIFTRVQQIDPNIESRLQEIDEILTQNIYWEKFGKSGGWREYNINLRQDFKRQLKKFNLGIIDNIENVNYKLGYS